MKFKVCMKIYKANTNQKKIIVFISTPVKVNFKVKVHYTNIECSIHKDDKAIVNF